MMNVAQYLLHFITARTDMALGHVLYRRTLAIGLGNFFQNPKKPVDKATSTALILYEGI
jgi:hypothetical protein